MVVMIVICGQVIIYYMECVMGYTWPGGRLTTWLCRML
jgi:hypothetical protein